jgi:flavodoxin
MLKKSIKGMAGCFRVFFLLVFIFTGCGGAKNEPVNSSHEPGPKLTLSTNEKTLIVYYSRSGKTEIVAKELAEQLSCDIEEISSKKNRQGFGGILTCVFDSVFDRYDEIETVKGDVKGSDQLIIVSPIWIHRVSSPVRTFIKDAGLQGKDIYLILTYNGSLEQEHEQEIKTRLAAHNVNLKGLSKIITKEKTEADIEKAAMALL